MKLIGFTMVKNEEDIIEQFIRHNLHYCSSLYIYNHDSTDRTADILNALIAEGLPVVDYTAEVNRLLPDRVGYVQGAVMNILFRIAVADNGPALYLPMDADEFFETNIRDFSELIRRIEALGDNVCFRVPWRCMIVPDGADDSFFRDVPKSFRYIEQWKETESFPEKIIIKLTNPDLASELLIRLGNHDLVETSAVQRVTFDAIRYIHVPVRTGQQVFRKLVCGWLSNVQAFGRDTTNGYHWKKFFDRICGGTLPSNQDLFAFTEVYARTRRDGVVNVDIVDASTMFDYEVRYAMLRDDGWGVILRDIENHFADIYRRDHAPAG